LGLDPDGTTYLDVADRIEALRAAHRRLVTLEMTAADPAMATDRRGEAASVRELL